MNALRNVQTVFLNIAHRRQVNRGVISNMTAQYKRRIDFLSSIITDAQASISRSLTEPSIRLRPEIQNYWRPALDLASEVEGIGAMSQMGNIVKESLSDDGVIDMPMITLHNSVIKDVKAILNKLGKDVG